MSTKKIIIYKTSFYKPDPSLHVHVYTGLGNKTVGIIFMIDYFCCSVFVSDTSS